MLMIALIPKGLAAAVLASLPLQLGLPDGQIIQGTVYAVIFFSILLCAVLVFVIESRRLDRLAASWLKPFAVAESGVPHSAPSLPAFEQSLGLPALPMDFQEPNPVQLTPSEPAATESSSESHKKDDANPSASPDPPTS